MKTLRFWALPVCQIAASYGAEAIFFYSLFDTKLHPDQDRIMEGGAADPFPAVAVILLPVVLTAAAIVWVVVWFLT